MENEMIFSINFIRGIHLFVSLLGAAFLAFVWLQFKKQETNASQNWGILLLAMVLLTWGAIDAFKISQGSQLSEIRFQTTLLSILNNTFILAALPFFTYGFEKIKKRFPVFKHESQWAISVILVNIFPIILNLLFWDEGKESIKDFIASVNVFYSVVAIGLLGYAITWSLYKRNFGIPIVVLSACISFLLIFTQFNYLPLFIVNYQQVSVFLIVISHISMIILLLVLTQSWINDKKEHAWREKLERKTEELARLKAEMVHIAHSTDSLASKGEKSTTRLPNGNYIRFFKEEKALIAELSMLEKGIIKARISSSLKREYKDLLRFAVYKKTGVEIKAYGGTHKDFGGDIYKSVSDIRKKLLNPALSTQGYSELKSNELIVQKIKGSGIYELDCLPEHIEIDSESLKKLSELAKMIEPISK